MKLLCLSALVLGATAQEMNMSDAAAAANHSVVSAMDYQNAGSYPSDPVLGPVARVTSMDYTDGEHLLAGYIAYPEVMTGPTPAVVIIPDWDGVNHYEQQRATMIADMGYIGFAADIYGRDLHTVETMDERISLSSMYGGNVTLFAQRIQAAVDYVSSLEDVDESNIVVAGYCFGGTGVLQYALSGAPSSGVVGIASFHGGLRNLPDPSVEVIPRILIQSGGEDDASSQIMELEGILDAANATWEITRYSDVEHAFTVWEDRRYNPWVDHRSWQAFSGFLSEVLGETSFDAQEPEETNVEGIPYSDPTDGTELMGYMAVPAMEMDGATAMARSAHGDGHHYPAVVIVPDWDGVNEYEQLRATLLAEEGYVGFAADIFGADLQSNLTMDQRINLTTYYRSNPEVFVSRIEAAVELVKGQSMVDPNDISIFGYCFGGTGAIEYAFAGLDDVKAIVAFHGGLQNLPSPDASIEPYILVLSGGIDDAHGNQTVLEESLDAADADWEITRYAGVRHGFTDWHSDWGYDLLADVRSWESAMTMISTIPPLMREGDDSEVESLATDEEMVATDEEEENDEEEHDEEEHEEGDEHDEEDDHDGHDHADGHDHGDEAESGAGSWSLSLCVLAFSAMTTFSF